MPNYPDFAKEHIFCYWYFLIKSIFKSLYFLKWCPIFDTSLHQFSKFNNLLWVCWFIGKNISNFELPAWKFNNPYCHNFQVSVQKRLSIHFHISDSIHSLFSKWANCQIDSLLKNHYCWVPPYCFWAYLLVRRQPSSEHPETYGLVKSVCFALHNGAKNYLKSR